MPANSSVPWTDSALGYYQVCKYYYWPGINEPSSAEECAVNKGGLRQALPDDLKQAVSFACESLYNQVWTEYTTNHAKALKKLVSDHGVIVKKLPDSGSGDHGVLGLPGDRGPAGKSDDELTRRIVTSFLGYREPRERLHALCRQRDHERQSCRALT